MLTFKVGDRVRIKDIDTILKNNKFEFDTLKLVYNAMEIEPDLDSLIRNLKGFCFLVKEVSKNTIGSVQSVMLDNRLVIYSGMLEYADYMPKRSLFDIRKEACLINEIRTNKKV